MSIKVSKLYSNRRYTGYSSEEIAVISTSCHGDMARAHSALAFCGARRSKTSVNVSGFLETSGHLQLLAIRTAQPLQSIYSPLRYEVLGL